MCEKAMRMDADKATFPSSPQRGEHFRTDCVPVVPDMRSAYL